jgi:tRNA-dihydrouridine synthase
MRYFKASENENSSFIQWDLWANSEEELQAIGEENNPLIRTEEEIQKYITPICPIKIVDGKLVEKSSEEMKEIELEYAQKLLSYKSQTLKKELKKLYDDIQFADTIFEDTTKLKEAFEIKRKEYTAIVEQTAQ